MKPLAIELFAGSFGWSAGWLALGGRAVGFDIQHLAHHGPVPEGAELVLQDVMTLHGSQFKDAEIIFASPPCQAYSWLAMPWSRSKPEKCKGCEGAGSWLGIPCLTCNQTGTVENSKAAKALRRKWETEGPDNRLFDACFRIQREAIAARAQMLGCCMAGNGLLPRNGLEPCPRCFIPLIVENVRGAQPWVGRSRWHHGSFHLWGDVPALMPRNGGKGVHLTSPQENAEGLKIGGDGTKQAAGRGDWFSKEARDEGASAKFSSRSSARKAAAAAIARIPYPLSEHLASVYWPR